jgi:hypothetical protein
MNNTMYSIHATVAASSASRQDPRERHGGCWLQPVLLIILRAVVLNHMKGISESGLRARIPFRFVKY